MGHRLVLLNGFVDLARRIAVVGTEQRRLTTLEADLLSFLSSQPSRTHTRDDLMEHVWKRKVAPRTIDTTVRRLRSKVEQHPASPVHLLAVQGEGYQFVPSASRRRDLPEGATTFRGRESEQARLQDFLRGTHGLLTLAGPPGIGKTRLAVEVAKGLSHDTEVHLVRLRGAVTFTDALLQVASALGLTVHRVEQARPRILSAVAARPRILLLLDSAEHLATDLGAFALQLAKEALVLVTSRVPLQVASERLVRVGGLEPDEAILLYQDVVRARSNATPPADRGDLTELMRALEHTPLAIELAAARSSVRSVPELLARLRTGLLVLERADRSPLTDAIVWSWGLLDASEQAVLVQLVAFPGGATLEALEGASEIAADAHPVGDFLERLVEHSLVRVVDSSVALRFVAFRMVHDVVVRLLPQARMADARRRAARWVAHACLARERDLAPTRPGFVLRMLEEERENLVQLADAVVDDAPGDAAGLWLALVPTETSILPHDVAIPLLERAYDAAIVAQQPRRALDILLRLSVALQQMGRVGDAGDVVARAMELATSLDDASRARACVASAVVHRFRGSPKAHDLLTQARRVADASDGLLLAVIGSEQAMLDLWAGDLTSAQRHIDDALRVLGGASVWMAIRLQQMRGELSFSAGELDRAAVAFHEVERARRAVGLYEVGLSRHQCLLGELAHARGDLVDATRRLCAARAHAERTGEHLLAGGIAVDLGMIAHEQGDLAQAERHYADALLPQDEYPGAPYALALLASIRAATPRGGDCEALLERGRELTAGSATVMAVVDVGTHLVGLARAGGDGGAASAALRDCLARLHEPRPSPTDGRTLPSLAASDHDLRIVIRIAQRMLDRHEAAEGALHNHSTCAS